MNQVERITENVFTITTGDDKIFNNFKWKHRSVNYPINGKTYEYPDRQGSKVDRRLLKSPIYDIEFWIDGEDANDQLNEFLKSAEDLNPWTIEHPVFGLIVGHPVNSINGNPQQTINGFLITFKFIESIIDEAVNGRDNTLEEIETLALEADELNQQIYEVTTDVDVSDRSPALEVLETIIEVFETIAAIGDAVDEFLNLVDDALAAIDQIAAFPANALASLQDLFNLPGALKARIQAKIDVYTDTFNALTDIFTNQNEDDSTGESTDSAKSFGAMVFTSTIQNLAISSVNDASQNTPDIIDVDETTGASQKSSLRTQTEIAQTVELIIEKYNQFITIYDQLEKTSVTPNGNSNIPSFSYKLPEDTVENLRRIVLLCTTNLTTLLRSAQPESTYINFEKINPINLFVQLYGFYDEQKFNEFILANALKANELIQISVNREIKYYP
jgi:hypothetical protein